MPGTVQAVRVLSFVLAGVAILTGLTLFTQDDGITSGGKAITGGPLIIVGGAFIAAGVLLTRRDALLYEPRCWRPGSSPASP